MDSGTVARIPASVEAEVATASIARDNVADVGKRPMREAALAAIPPGRVRTRPTTFQLLDLQLGGGSVGGVATTEIEAEVVSS